VAIVKIQASALIDVIITLAAICAGLGIGIGIMLWIVGRFMP
jgi:hypothetical protein